MRCIGRWNRFLADRSLGIPNGCLALVKLLEERHARSLDRHQQMIVAGLWLAMRASEMTETFGCSEATVTRTQRQAVRDVFDFTELTGTPQLLRLGAELHRSCCTAAAREVTETSHLLTGW